MKRLLICFVFLAFAVSTSKAQTSQEEETQAFIIKVVSAYKNPMAYYPLRRDLFLPSQEEIDSLERAIDKYALYYSSPILILGDDSLKREPFVNAQGQLLFPAPLNPLHSSKTSDYQFFKRKQERMLSSNPNLGKFLLYNQQFKKSDNPEKH